MTRRPSPADGGSGETRRLIAVIGSGTAPHSALARPLGEWLAREGHHLLSGGGGGVMEETAAGFHGASGRGGLAIGILPGRAAGAEKPAAPPGYPNPFVDIAIRTHLPRTGAQGKAAMSRNHLIVLSAHAVVALPGGEGTRSEIELALHYGTPLLLFAPGGEWRNYADRAASASRHEEVFAWLRDMAGGPGR